jgi:hypothetical protein
MGGSVKRVIGAAVTVVIAAIVVAAIGVGFHAQRYTSPAGTQVATSLGTAVVNGKTVPHVQLTFATYPDSSGTMIGGQPIHPGGNPMWPAYAPTNEFQVPAGALVTVKWDQYDSGGALNDNFFAYPHGIVGPLLINGKSVSHIPLWNVGHTFTVRAEPGTDSRFFLSVASPADGDSPTDRSKPQTVQFSFIAGTKGLYAWNCEFPCGDGVAGFGAVMGAYGYMSGYLHVT